MRFKHGNVCGSSVCTVIDVSLGLTCHGRCLPDGIHPLWLSS